MSHLVSLCLISPTLSRRSSNSVSLCAVGSCEVALPHGQGQVPAFPGGLTWKATAQGDSLVKLGVSLSLRFCTWPPPDLLQHRPRALANTQKSALPKSLPWLPIAFRTTVSAGAPLHPAARAICLSSVSPGHSYEKAFCGSHWPTIEAKHPPRPVVPRVSGPRIPVVPCDENVLPF
uniref:Uncharacterized protein n=1 Tax=Myotis myotis TaxID=51298 RepID=A0A7J7XHG4_MYOMY|nr:hypothetical protein mMyoMyo1_011640 [Myotis myotis]